MLVVVFVTEFEYDKPNFDNLPKFNEATRNTDLILSSFVLIRIHFNTKATYIQMKIGVLNLFFFEKVEKIQLDHVHFTHTSSQLISICNILVCLLTIILCCLLA